MIIHPPHQQRAVDVAPALDAHASALDARVQKQLQKLPRLIAPVTETVTETPTVDRTCVRELIAPVSKVTETPMVYRACVTDTCSC